MHRLFLVFCLSTAFSLGCSNQENDTSSQAGSNGGTELKDAVAEDHKVSRKELDEWINSRFSDTSGWHYGEREEGELVGTWTVSEVIVPGLPDSKESTDESSEDQHPIVFSADGFFRDDFGKGLFAISESGDIMTIVKSESGGKLSSQMRLEDGAIFGSQGPAPEVKWTRQQPTDPISR